MNRVIKIEGPQMLALMRQLGDMAELAESRCLRVMIDDEGVKFKVNNRTWGPGLGKVDD